MTRKTLLRHLDAGKSLRLIASAEHCSSTNVRYWLRKYSLRTASQPFSKQPRICRTCGTPTLGNVYGHKARLCRRCQSDANIQRGQTNTAFAHSLLGKICKRCKFSDSRALAIHHTDPTRKDPAFKNVRYWSKQRIKRELRTCVLLCQNCHAIEHHEQRQKKMVERVAGLEPAS